LEDGGTAELSAAEVVRVGLDESGLLDG
jgi:hypothetical protein